MSLFGHRNEIELVNVAFPNQGGNHKFANVVAFQTNHGADRYKVSDGMQKRKIGYCCLSK